MDKLPFKHEGGWLYVAQSSSPDQDVSLATFPYASTDNKQAGAFVRMAAERGWHINMASWNAGIRIGKLFERKIQEPDYRSYAYVAEKKCGCIVSHMPTSEDEKQRKQIGKILQVWAEERFYIYTLPIDELHLNGTCPHVAQQTSMFDGSAETVEGEYVEDDDNRGVDYLPEPVVIAALPSGLESDETSDESEPEPA